MFPRSFKRGGASGWRGSESYNALPKRSLLVMEVVDTVDMVEGRRELE